MPCKIRIRQQIVDDIDSRLSDALQQTFAIAKRKAADINVIYGPNTVNIVDNRDHLDREINIPENIVDLYYDNELNMEKLTDANPQQEDAERVGEEYDENYLMQLAEMPASKASADTISKIKEAAKKMGIDIQKLSDYLKGNPDVKVGSANGLADLLHGIVAIAEGKENITLTEEMVHVATAILEQTHPTLVTEMIGKIDKFSIYKQVFDTYKNNPHYQLSNGKPDIRKIKKEAVDKLIVELIINNAEGTTEFPELLNEINKSTIRTWWQKILDWFRSFYKKSNLDIFQQTAARITEGEVGGTVEDITQGGIFLQETSQYSKEQLDVQKMIVDTRNQTKRVESNELVDPLFQDTEEASNWYERQNASGVWERVKKRVTDRVKAWYKEKFFTKAFTEEEKEFNEMKRTLGVKFHKFMEEIHGRYFNEDGTQRTTPDNPPSLSKTDEQVYNKLESYFVDMVNSLSKNGKMPLVFAESILFDPKQQEAGTLDLFIVEEDGTAHVLDWKFMSISDKSKDVPWFKKGAFNIQLGRYKDILRENYGIKKFGMTRAIPVLLRFERVNKMDRNSELNFTGIKIGSVDVKDIEDLRLLPVAEENESTGEERLDEIIRKLNAVYSQISNTDAVNEEAREFKAARLKLLEEAIRKAQIQQDFSSLIGVISEIRDEGNLILDTYNMVYKDQSINSTEFTDRQLSDFADRLREYIAVTKVFGNVSDYIGDLIYNPRNLSGKKKRDKRNKTTLEKIKKQQDEIRVSELEIRKVAGQFADRFIGMRNREVDLLSPEAVINGIGSYFDGVADFPLASLRILYKLVTNAKGKAAKDSFKDATDLMEIRKRLADRGGDFRQLVQNIYQKDADNKLVNKLIYKYDRKFYDDMKNNSLEGNKSIEWIKNNVDIQAYEDEYIPVMNSTIEHLKVKYKYDREVLRQLTNEEKDKWDITRPTFNGWTNYILRRNPKAKWLSKEYLEIKNDADLFALYQYIEKINDRASEAGYIQNKIASTFLPYVRKTMAESLAWDIDKTGIMKWDNMMNSLTIDASTVGYGAVNKLNGELELAIPKYFVSDFTKDEETGKTDTSDLSEELFKNLIMYTNHVNKYIYLSAVEGQLKLVKDIEEFKSHWVTSQVGKVDFSKQGKPTEEIGNEVNFKLFDDFLRGVLYEQKYPLSNTDIELNTGILNGMAKAINELAGVKVFSPSDKPSSISLVKSIDMLNRGFQLKTLGFEIVSGAVNAFGGNIQVMIQAGNYFTTGEFLTNERELIGNSFKSDDEREMFIQIVNTFMPLKDDPTYDLLKEAGMTSMTRTNFSDVLMMFMRQPEQHIEKSIFLSLLQNMMIVDGKIVSIREYVKAKYPNRYSSSAEYHAAKEKINEEIKELKETKSINVTKQLVDGKLVIPGLDLNNQNEVQRLTALTRRIARHATGGISDSDLNKASMSIWMRSVMVFKMWIPKLLSTRFSHFERTSDDFSTIITEDGISLGDKYEIGRIRLWWYTMMTSIRDKSMNVMNILEVNEKGLIALDKMYEDFALNYKLRTGKEMNMSKEEFNDMIIQSLRNQMRELAILVSVFGATFALGIMKPPEDADKATKNAFRYMQRVLDKFKQEVSFFYNPVEFEKLLSGGTFPAIALISDINRFAKHAAMEWTGLDISDPTLTYDEVVEKAQPVKNLMKIFPITKPALTWGASISSDFAEYFDITVPRGNQMK